MRKKLLPILALLLMTVTCAVAQNTHTVTLKEGTEDAVNWKGKVGNDATVGFSALPLENVTEGATVTLQYNGTKEVKSVTAVKKKAEPAVTLATPLTMEALTAGTIEVINPRSGMKYSLNGVDTITMTTTTNITVSAGDKVAFFGDGTNITSYYYTTITGSGEGFTCKVYGNIMSLVDENGYETAITLPFYCYYKMFHGCSNLSSVTCLATSGINQNFSTDYWLYGVATTGTFTKDANANWEAGYSGIPSGWTQTSTPINLSSNADGTVWTLNPMPGFDVELEIEYYQPAGDSFTVTYMDGNVELNVDTFYNQQPISEYIPSKLGWKFTGWNPALPELMPDENLTTYAQWTCDSVQDVDGNKYPTLFVNNTCWMTENLRTTRYADGRDIANIYEYQSAFNQNVPQHYGLLYNWYDALDVNRPSTRATSPVYIQGVCPQGYHIPTAAEVAFLLNTPAHALCSTTGWITPNGNTNSSEFTAYPAGLYNSAPARYEGLGTQTDWWMASGTQNHQSLQIQYYCSTPQIVNRNPDDAVSVRCVLND